MNLETHILKNLFRFAKSLSFKRWIKWVYYSMLCTIARLTGGLHRHIQVMDTYLGKHTRKIDKHYSAGIAYQGGRCAYYLIERVNADVKIGYVHNDYTQSVSDYMLKPKDDIYFPKLDFIITVSPQCLNSLKKEFPHLEHKCMVIENICSAKKILRMAESGDSFCDGYVGIRLVTLGRLVVGTKGIDLIIDVCKILKEGGIDYKWYFLGDGRGRSLVERLIRENNVEENLILLGAKLNPYPYIKDADIYVQPSRYEGKSVALDEVKVLCRPVVVTDFSTVHDQFTDGINALIAKINAEDIAEKIICLINDKTLRVRFENNLKQEKTSNEEQAEIFKSLIIKS